jgi:tetratricopeptide (TPR) repeat protein
LTPNNNIPQSQLEEIERFLQDEMDAEEEKHFLGRMEQDSVLQQQVEEIRLLMVAVGEAVLQQKMNLYHGQVATPERRSIGRSRWLAAASVIIIILAAAFWFSGSPRTKQLFTEYFVPDAGLITSMGTSDNYAFDRAMVDYKTGNYKAAIDAWQRLPQSDSTRYFIASAHLAATNADSAIVYFEKILSRKESPFYDEANWYAGLALLRLNKPKEAIPFIKRSTHKKKNELLSKLTP